MRHCLFEYDEEETMRLFREEGKEDGIAIGEARGVIKGKVQQIAAFIKDGFISEEEGAKRANMSIDEFREYEALYCS